MDAPRRVLFVCLGNICRSPTAEGIFRHLAEAEGLSTLFEVDSAGTGSWHIGEPPDARMTRAAREAGYRLQGLARQVRGSDFARFHHIFAMDRANLEVLRQRAPTEHLPKIRLFRDHDPDGAGLDVPDPYYGGDEGFAEVVRIVERTSRALLETLRAETP